MDRIAVGLRAGLAPELVLLYVLSSAITRDGSRTAPAWLPVVLAAAVLAVAVSGVIMGARCRRSDASVLGTIALVVTSFIGGWVALTSVAHLFVE
jgi:hypothetical protein